jgi:hypothetical protein
MQPTQDDLWSRLAILEATVRRVQRRRRDRRIVADWRGRPSRRCSTGRPQQERRCMGNGINRNDQVEVSDASYCHEGWVYQPSLLLARCGSIAAPYLKSRSRGICCN